MNDRQKDLIGDVCDEKDWEVSWHDDGCTITTHNGTSVEYHYDADERIVDLRCKGRMRTVAAVLAVIDRAKGGA